MQLDLQIAPRALGGTHTRMPNTHATIWRILTSLPIQSSGSQARRPSPGLSNQSAFVTRFPKVIGLGCQVGVATFISRADNWLINVQPMARESREHRASVRNRSEASLTCEQWKLSTEKDTEVGQYVKTVHLATVIPTVYLWRCVCLPSLTKGKPIKGSSLSLK